MITEDYISFETAKLLKEKGFDECCRAFITPNVSFALEEDRVFNHLLSNNEYAVPTLQMAMKWLRVHNIFISIVCCTYPTLNKATWIPDITTFESVFPDSVVECNTYEEACEAAIKYCLENLV